MHYLFNGNDLEDFLGFENYEIVKETLNLEPYYEDFLPNVIDERKAKFIIKPVEDDYNVFYGGIKLIPKGEEFAGDELIPNLIEDLESNSQVYIDSEDVLSINNYIHNIAELPDPNPKYVGCSDITYEIYSIRLDMLFFLNASDLKFVEGDES